MLCHETVELPAFKMTCSIQSETCSGRKTMIKVSVTEARANLDALLDKVQAGEEVLVTRRGKPVARIMPITLKPLPLEELAAFRATMPSLGRPSAELLREMRDEGY